MTDHTSTTGQTPHAGHDGACLMCGAAEGDGAIGWGTSERSLLDATLEDLGEIPTWADPLAPGFNPLDPNWQGLSLPERQLFMVACQRRNVLVHGVSYVGVMAPHRAIDGPPSTGELRLDHPYTYTIGIDPAYLVIGAVNMYTQHIIELTQAEQRRPGEMWDHNDTGYYLATAPIPPEWFKALCGQAILHGATGARQVIVQDDNHRWPWDEGCDLSHIPVLAGEDWRPDPPAGE